MNVFCDKVVCIPIIPSQKNKSCRNHWKLKTAMIYTFDHNCITGMGPGSAVAYCVWSAVKKRKHRVLVLISFIDGNPTVQDNSEHQLYTSYYPLAYC